jgi:hypothetical protein
LSAGLAPDRRRNIANVTVAASLLSSFSHAWLIGDE